MTGPPVSPPPVAPGPSPAPLPLGYAADVPTRHGIVYDLAGPVARIVLPAPSRFRYRVVGLLTPAVIFAFAVFGVARNTHSIVHPPQARGGFSHPAVRVVGLVVWTFVAAVAARAIVRLARGRAVVELDGSRLTVRTRDGYGRPYERSWRRAEVAGVTAGPVPWNAPPGMGLGLHVRIAGRTIEEVLGGQDPAVARWVAERLTEALAAPPDTPDA